MLFLVTPAVVDWIHWSLILELRGPTVDEVRALGADGAGGGGGPSGAALASPENALSPPMLGPALKSAVKSAAEPAASVIPAPEIAAPPVFGQAGQKASKRTLYVLGFICIAIALLVAFFVTMHRA